MLINLIREPKQADETSHRKSSTAKMLNSLRIAREKKLQSGKPETDAEIVIIDKLIHEFESDLQRMDINYNRV